MVKFIEKELGNGENNLTHSYNHVYKENAFQAWYGNNQITSPKLLVLLQAQDGHAPAKETLSKWIVTWRDRAAELDQEAKDQFTKEVIETKVEMLRRHAKAGRELQDIGMDWVRENKDQLTAASVTRIIKDGYEMEKSSVGVPEALEKMLSTSDEELVKQIEAAIAGEDLDLFDAD